MTDAIGQAKAELRATMRAARRALDPADRLRKAAAVAGLVAARPEWQRAGTVLVFLSFGAELPTGPLIDSARAAGKRVAVPVVRDDELVPVTYEPGDPVEATSYGASEPIDGTPVPVEEIDLVIVPGLAFDAAGYRVGYGGGFYDRFLPRLRSGVASISVGYAEQLVDDVPHHDGDRPVTAVVTA